MSINYRCEPARVSAIIAAVLTLAVSFGLSLTAEQQGAIAALAYLVAGEWVRARSIPVETVRQAGLNPADVVADANNPAVAPYAGEGE